MQTNEQKNFLPFAPPLSDARRRAELMDFDEQTVATIDHWAAQYGARFAGLMDQIAELLAGAILAASGPPGGVARNMRILDLDRLIDLLIDRSIRPARGACGNLTRSATQAQDSHAPADPETERRREILNYYAALTGNRITARDHAKLKAIFDLPDLVIQAGILHALNYATRPIGSFAYCVRAMDNFLDATIDLDATISTLIDKLLRKRATGQLVLPLAGEKLLIGDFNSNHE